MIGHIENKFTVPLGVRARIDADRGTITLLEPAVR
jgi:muramoyltetrapeptide carboxypeptidase